MQADGREAHVGQFQVRVHVGVAVTAGPMLRRREQQSLRPHEPDHAMVLPANQEIRGQIRLHGIHATPLRPPVRVTHVRMAHAQDLELLAVVQRDVVAADLPVPDGPQPPAAGRVETMQHRVQTIRADPAAIDLHTAGHAVEPHHAAMTVEIGAETGSHSPSSAPASHGPHGSA